MSEDADAEYEPRPEVQARERRSGRFDFLVPRFGTGWLFVAMLLLISVAGWWKFHRDLYVEEVEVIRSLRSSAGKVVVRRAGSIDVRPAEEEDFDGGIPWNAPLLPRVEVLSVEGELKKELRNEAARLPRVKSTALRPSPPSAGVRVVQTPGQFDFEAHLNRSLPESPPVTLSIESVSKPLPDGEPVDADEAARISDAIYDAWRDEDAIPSRAFVVCRSVSLQGPPESELEVNIVQPNRRLFFCDRDWFQQAAIQSDGISHNYFRNLTDAWSIRGRDAEADVQRHDEVYRRLPDDPFPYIAPDFYGAQTVQRAITAMPQFEFERIAKVDDVRYRIDFRPFAAGRNERDLQFNVIDPQVTEWSLVLRSDLNWVPEESKMIQRIQQTSWNAPKNNERQISQRFRRDGGYVMLTERAVRGGGGPPGCSIGSPFSLHLYASEINPEFDERIFDPSSLDQDAWPARRELPWLRWYRVTFLLGCGLAVALVGRRIMSGRADNGRRLRESSEADRAESDG